MKWKRGLLDISLRYFLLVLTAIPSFWLFYLIFAPLTIYPVYFLLKIFFDAVLYGNLISIGNVLIVLIDACIAGSAYYVLFALNISIPKINFKKRAEMIVFSFVTLLILNVLRIFFLSILAINGSSYFDVTHKLFWYSISILFVVLIWFAEVKIFKIKEIPVYSDLKFVYSMSSFKK